ncbi:hypothetical protein TVAG_350090 [Trichomonas vaginalis G3]|uniref:Uncharacterized protein n=1 Tax=Trichomonas vaginalis (strain ATCC PRA-98 / G3) TaxID=412133 RepID=A2F3J0_TRIV3|nr:hypothetical protein TVAGG3_0194300 [Trichomonas vaginalis G3]EAY00513.1 hypothetical protein TVAG_350090 [Trichomonas vaginalis G3]KAI5550196.1 hypothetical protein TVAGG3_0194300 [Trichomonas vaginalis G3]|eukprot:XP_001313442.1 hypothetical protein [Trichomonas vaginalis G3]
MNQGEIISSLTRKIQDKIRALGPTNISRWNSFCGFDEMTQSQFAQRSTSLGVRVNKEDIQAIWKECGIKENIIDFKSFVRFISLNRTTIFNLPENTERTRQRLIQKFLQYDSRATGFVSIEQFDDIAHDFSIMYENCDKYDTNHDGRFNYFQFMSDINSQNQPQSQKLPEKPTSTEKKEETAKIETETKQTLVPPKHVADIPSVNETQSRLPAYFVPSIAKLSSPVVDKIPEEINVKDTVLSPEEIYDGQTAVINLSKLAVSYKNNLSELCNDVQFGDRITIANLCRLLRTNFTDSQILYITEEYGDPMSRSSLFRLVADGDKFEKARQLKGQKPFDLQESEIEAVLKWLRDNSNGWNYKELIRAKSAEEASLMLAMKSIFITADDLRPAYNKYRRALPDVIFRHGQNQN